MKRLLLLLTLVTLPFTQALADSTKQTVKAGKTTREYYVHLPPGFSSQQSLPVVLLFHGGGGEATGMEDMSGMDAVADKHGFIAVYPEGTRKTWNGGLCCGHAAKENIDDVGFVSTMIEDLHQRYHIDTKRVYATGISNGAQMSYRLSCELSTKITAIAPVSGQLELPDGCHPARKVPVLHIHGTADPCSPYSGGTQCGGCWGSVLPMLGGKDNHWPCPPVEQLVKDTAKRNGCTGAMKPAYSKGAVTCEAFERCPEGDDVTLCKINGGGHTWPSGEVTACKGRRKDGWFCRKYREAVGPVNYDINASEFMWQFFAAHHL